MEKRTWMHEWLEEDAVELDLTTEEIIQQLATDNASLKAEVERLRGLVRGARPWIQHFWHNAPKPGTLTGRWGEEWLGRARTALKGNELDGGGDEG